MQMEGLFAVMTIRWRSVVHSTDSCPDRWSRFDKFVSVVIYALILWKDSKVNTGFYGFLIAINPRLSLSGRKNSSCIFKTHHSRNLTNGGPRLRFVYVFDVWQPRCSLESDFELTILYFFCQKNTLICCLKCSRFFSMCKITFQPQKCSLKGKKLVLSFLKTRGHCCR
jgi:hypothetical protein